MNIVPKSFGNTLERILLTAIALTRIWKMKEEKLAEVIFLLCSANHNCSFAI